MEALVRGSRPDAQGHLGEEAEPAFAAEHRLAQVGPGARRWQAADREFAARRRHPAGVEELLDPAVAQRLLAGRAGHDPAAGGRELERLREVAERHAVRRQRRLDRRAGRAGAEARGQIRGVERLQRHQPLERDVEHRPVALGHMQVADDAGAATIGNDERAEPLRLVECGDGLGVRGRQGDAIGHPADAAAAQRDPVGQALAEGMIEADRRVGVERTGGRQPTGPYRLQGRFARDAGRRHGDADAFGEKATGTLRQRGVFGVAAPAVPATGHQAGARSRRSNRLNKRSQWRSAAARS